MMARALALNGAHKVYIIGRRREKLEETAREAKNGSIIPMPGDVTSKASLEGITARIRDGPGYVNLVIGNAGISPIFRVPIGPTTTVEEFASATWATTMELFTSTYEVNCTGVFYTAVAFLPLLAAGNDRGNMPGLKSQFMATSSAAAFNRIAPNGFNYATSKAGATLMVKELATILVPFDIRANVLAPGMFDTDVNSTVMPAPGKRKTEEGAFERNFIPARRMGGEADMTGTILYIASRAGSYMNGNVLLLDGGRLGTMPSTY